MKYNEAGFMVLLSVVLVAGGFVFRVCVDYCEAQEAVERGEEIPWCSEDDAEEGVLTLARLAHHEAGSSRGDVEGIRRVLTALAVERRVGFTRMARWYAPRATRGATRRSAWIHGLGWRCEPEVPAGWPRRAGSWARAEREWFTTLVTAEAAWRGEVDSPCAGSVHDWGASSIRESAKGRLLWVECRGVRNDYWARPSLRRRERCER